VFVKPEVWLLSGSPMPVILVPKGRWDDEGYRVAAETPLESASPHGTYRRVTNGDVWRTARKEMFRRIGLMISARGSPVKAIRVPNFNQYGY